MEAQQQIAFDWSRRQIGRELDVLIDGPDPEVPNHLLAERNHFGAVTGIGIRAHFGDPACNNLHLTFGILAGHARLEMRNNNQGPISTLHGRELGGIRRIGEP